MATNNRHIRRRGFTRGDSNEHTHPSHWGKANWMVPFTGEHALMHHNHISGEDHDLCGPLVFCCPRAVNIFRRHYPNSTTSLATWEKISAEQVITWMDAGVQMVYFVFVHPSLDREVTAVGLSGGEARKALLKELALDAYVASGKNVIEELSIGIQQSNQ